MGVLNWIFSYEDSSLCPASRFFLARFVREVGPGQDAGYTVKEFSKLLGVNDRAVSRSLSALVGAGVLHKNRKKSGSYYRLNDSIYDAVSTEGADSPEGAMLSGEKRAELVGMLLSDHFQDSRYSNRFARKGGEEDDQDEQDVICREKLTVAARVLLCVLICHSDFNGVVRSLNHAALKKLTGMKPSQIRRHVQRLQEAGFISFYLPGASSRTLMGKSSSQFYLNVVHSKLRSAYGVSRWGRLRGDTPFASPDNVAEQFFDFSCLHLSHKSKVLMLHHDRLRQCRESLEPILARLASEDETEVKPGLSTASSSDSTDHSVFAFSDIAYAFAETEQTVRRGFLFLVTDLAFWVAREHKQLLGEKGVEIVDSYFQALLEGGENEGGIPSIVEVAGHIRQFFRLDRFVGAEQESKDESKVLLVLVRLCLYVARYLSYEARMQKCDIRDTFLLPKEEARSVAFLFVMREKPSSSRVEGGV